jgi:Mn2+/Fe2+ NRAMP family transporter
VVGTVDATVMPHIVHLHSELRISRVDATDVTERQALLTTCGEREASSTCPLP